MENEEIIYKLASEFIQGRQYYEKKIICTDGYIGTWYLRGDVNALSLKPSRNSNYYNGNYYAANYNQTRVYNCYDIQISQYGSVFYNFYEGTHTNGWLKTNINSETGFINFGGNPFNYTLASIGVYDEPAVLKTVLDLLGYKISDKILFVNASTVEDLLALDDLTIDEVLEAKSEGNNYLYKEIELTAETFIPDTYYIKYTPIEYDMEKLYNYNVCGIYESEENL